MEHENITSTSFILPLKISTIPEHPQTNGICERFHKTMQEEFIAVAFRKKIYNSIDQLQADVDSWIDYYNKERPHSGKYCFGKTPTCIESLHLTKNKMLETWFQKDVSLPPTGDADEGSGAINLPGISCPTGMVKEALTAPNTQGSFQEKML